MKSIKSYQKEKINIINKYNSTFRNLIMCLLKSTSFSYAQLLVFQIDAINNTLVFLYIK